MNRLMVRKRVGALLKLASSKQVKRIAIICSGVVAGLFLLVQVFYPTNRALPFTKMSGHDVSGFIKSDIGDLANELYDRSTVEVRGQDKVMLARAVSAVGVKMDQEQLIDQVVRYPWWLRLIPTSILWGSPSVDSFPSSVDKEVLGRFAVDNQANLAVAAENARLSIEGAEVKIVGGSGGAHLSPDRFIEGVSETKYRLGNPTVLAVNFTITEPAIRKDDLEAQRVKVQSTINREFSLAFDSVSDVVARAKIASWIVIDQDDIKNAEEIELSLNSDKVAQYLTERFADAVNRPAGVTEVNLVDGVEQSRESGPSGRAIDSQKTLAVIGEVLLADGDQPQTVDVATKVVQPRIKKNHTFTKSQAGLQAYASSLADEGDIRLSVQQVGGNGWSASYRSGEQTVAASTYKVYVVAYALNQIADKKMSYNDKINGLTMRECIERTIVQSDNDCPEAMMEKFGRTNLNNFLYSRGYSRSTTFTNTTASQTTTGDLARAMLEINNGQLVKGAERTFMLQLMGRTNHRQGIPAGSAGSVQNKVGFLWSYLNDAAIVKHPRGTYVISVMTKDQSWSKIAEITKKVESLMY